MELSPPAIDPLVEALREERPSPAPGCTDVNSVRGPSSPCRACCWSCSARRASPWAWPWQAPRPRRCGRGYCAWGKALGGRGAPAPPWAGSAPRLGWGRWRAELGRQRLAAPGAGGQADVAHRKRRI